jgi:HlyD family secretion protein
MKKYFFLFLLFSIVISCNNQAKKDKADIDKMEQKNTVKFVVGIGKILPENDIIQLSSPVNGIVQNIYKMDNDSVNVGTPVLQLEHQLEDAKVNQLSSEVITQAVQIKADEAIVGEYEAKCNNASAEFQRLQQLFEKGAETQQAVDNANTDLKAFQANLKKLQTNVLVSKSRLDELKAALQVSQIERDQKIILSPVKGKLLELTVLIGSSIDPQKSLAQICPEGKTIAICEIDELYAEKITVGQKGWIRKVGSTDTLSTGTVYFTFSFLKRKSLFTDQPGEKEDRRVRTIKILLDRPGKLLLNARIECVVDISKILYK